MIKNRVYEMPDGSVHVVTFAPNARKQGESDQDFANRIWEKMKLKDPTLPDAYVDIEKADMPERVDADGVSIRNQWRLKNKKLQVDPSVKNFYRKLYDDQKSLDALLDKDEWTDQELKQIEKLRNKVERWKAKLSG